MMNRQSLTMMWDHMRQTIGMGLRCVEALPADKLDSHPIANMRTPKDLVVHMYGMALRSVVEGAAAGEIKALDEEKIVAGIRTRDELVKYCRECWDAADRAATGITDAQLTASVKTPWGMDFPGFVCFGITNDEFLHHRGQLYTYLRALGQDVPMMWDFEHNAPGFQPQAQQPA